MSSAASFFSSNPSRVPDVDPGGHNSCGSDSGGHESCESIFRTAIARLPLVDSYDNNCNVRTADAPATMSATALPGFQMTLAAGARLGPCEILSALGAGGMGTTVVS